MSKTMASTVAHDEGPNSARMRFPTIAKPLPDEQLGTSGTGRALDESLKISSPCSMGHDLYLSLILAVPSTTTPDNVPIITSVSQACIRKDCI